MPGYKANVDFRCLLAQAFTPQTGFHLWKRTVQLLTSMHPKCKPVLLQSTGTALRPFACLTLVAQKSYLRSYCIGTAIQL